MSNILILDFKEIGKILDCIHDQWFKKEDIIFNPELSNLEIKFNRENLETKKNVRQILFFKKWRFSVIESKLRISNVLNYKIEDRSQIGGSDFNKIGYKEKEHRIIITCGVPFEIQIDVKEFKIELEDTNNIVDEKQYWSLF